LAKFKGAYLDGSIFEQIIKDFSAKKNVILKKHVPIEPDREHVTAGKPVEREVIRKRAGEIEPMPEKKPIAKKAEVKAEDSAQVRAKASKPVDMEGKITRKLRLASVPTVKTKIAAPKPAIKLKKKPESVAEPAPALEEPKEKKSFEEKDFERLLSNNKCVECSLAGADLAKKKLKGADLERANLEGADLERANLKGANLKGANLKGANLKGANLEDVDFYKANLEGADFTDAALDGAALDGAELKGAVFYGASLKKTYLEGVSIDTEK